MTQSTKFLRIELEIAQSSHLQQPKSSQLRSSSLLGGGGGGEGVGVGPHTRSHPSDIPARSSDVLHLSLSEDSNPLNLYLATVDLDTFQQMCKEQNIFVDFSQLPAQISALLDFCVLNRREQHQLDQNRFLCVIKHTEDSPPSALLDILEHNDFRNLLHLRLRFERATAEAASQWLARKLLMQRRVN